MSQLSRQEVADLCNEVLVPRLEDLLDKRIGLLRELLELSARGVAQLHERLDLVERGGEQQR